MMRKLKRFFLILLAVLMAMGTLPFFALADEEDMEVPPVFHKDDENDVVRLVVGKTPSVTIGKTSTISISLKNTTDTDWLEAEVWIAQESHYRE